jgi:hypothetical protein
MRRSAIAAVAAYLGLFAAGSAHAEDLVIRRDASGKDVTLSGTITAETPAGIKIKVGKNEQVVPPDEVEDVSYQLPDVTEIEFRTPHAKETDALGKVGDDRKKGLDEAVGMYNALLKKVKSSPTAKRFIEYRIAMAAVEEAKNEPTKTQAAIDALNAFRTANGGGWEIIPATQTAARLLEESGDKSGAMSAYADLANNTDVPTNIRLDMNLLVARMLMRDGKYKDAGDKLTAVLADAKDEKQKAYVQVYLIQTQAAQGQAVNVADLQKAIQGAGDDDKLKALTFNTLGDYYEQAKQPEEAFWRYLRVDVLYNQDREEHARALYHLWKLFDSVRGDAQRSKECLDRLKDKSLDGTDYQARAVKEEGGAKSP